MPWLDLFCERVACTEGFRRQLHSQLARQFADQTGMGLDGFVLVPPLEGNAAINFDSDGAAYLETDLVAADGNGYPVTLGWQGLGIKEVLPSDVRIEEGSTLVAWWQQLPADELKSRYSGTRGAPWPKSAEFPFDPQEYSFVVEWDVFAWPDVWLEVETARAAFPQLQDLLVDALIQAMERWNEAARKEEAVGVIHNLATQQKVLSTTAMVVNVDFGSASPAALVAMLQAIQQVADKLAVKQVLCRAPSTTRFARDP